MTKERTERYLISALHATIAFVLFSGTYFMLMHLISMEPFGHDEAVYLTEARSWSEGTPAEEWEIYRPIAMSVYAWLIFFFDDSLVTMRSFGVVFGAFTAGIIFLFYRNLTNLWVALATTVVVASSTLFLKQAPLFRNDVPSAALLVAALWLVYLHFKSGGKSYSVYLVAPLCALAFYTRYAVATTLVVIAVFTCIFLLPRFLKQQDASLKNIWWTAGLSALLFFPFFVVSRIIMGDFLGILEYAGSAAHPPAYVGEALLQYMRWIPGELGGIPLSAAAIAGAVGTVVTLSISRLRENYFHLAWTGSIGLASFIVTGLFTHADPRYVFFPLVLLSGTGIACLYYLFSNWSQSAATAVIIAAIAASAYIGVGNFREVDAFYKARALSPTSNAYADVYDAINADTAGRPCSIWLVEYLPKASWLTRCSVYAITNPGKYMKDETKHPENIRYSVVNTKLPDTQIQEESKERFNLALTEIFRSTKLPSGDLILYRIEGPAAPFAATTTEATTTPQQ